MFNNPLIYMIRSEYYKNADFREFMGNLNMQKCIEYV